jgi:hypothetical protein
MVIQLYGVEWGDLVVQGQFGAGGWREQAIFFKHIQSLVLGTASAQIQQILPDKSLINPSGSVRFVFPLLNYDFMVFIKKYQSVEGMAVELYNENINPTWQLTMTIDNDNAGLQKIASDQYIARLAQGLGYKTNQGYNGPVTSDPGAANDLQSFVQNYSTDQNLYNTFEQNFGGSSGSATGSGPATGSSSTNPNTSGAQTLTPGQIAQNAIQVGFTGPNLVIAIAIALAESGGRTWAINNDSNGSQDQGVWQINTVHMSQFAGMTVDPNSTPGSGTASSGTSSMFNPLNNAKAAFSISSSGTNWSPWSTYGSGAYQQYLATAQQAAGTH